MLSYWSGRTIPQFSLQHSVSLGGWLHTLAWHVAMRQRAAVSARKRHEQEARLVNSSRAIQPAAPELDWEKLRPVLDELLGQIRPPAGPVARVIQHHTLGSARYQHTYSLPPVFQMESYLAGMDEPGLSRETISRLGARLAEKNWLNAAIYTARPCLPPRELTAEEADALDRTPSARRAVQPARRTRSGRSPRPARPLRAPCTARQSA